MQTFQTSASYDKGDPRHLRVLFERASQLSREHRLPSVFVGVAGPEGDLLVRDFLDFVEAELRVEDVRVPPAARARGAVARRRRPRGRERRADAPPRRLRRALPDHGGAPHRARLPPRSSPAACRPRRRCCPSSSVRERSRARVSQVGARRREPARARGARSGRRGRERARVPRGGCPRNSLASSRSARRTANAGAGRTAGRCTARASLAREVGVPQHAWRHRVQRAVARARRRGRGAASPTASSRWIHGNHWRPLPMRPPSPARNARARSGSAPPARESTTREAQPRHAQPVLDGAPRLLLPRHAELGEEAGAGRRRLVELGLAAVAVVADRRRADQHTRALARGERRRSGAPGCASSRRGSSTCARAAPRVGSPPKIGSPARCTTALGAGQRSGRELEPVPADRPDPLACGELPRRPRHQPEAPLLLGEARGERPADQAARARHHDRRAQCPLAGAKVA